METRTIDPEFSERYYPIIKPEVNDLTVTQELRLLESVKSTLEDARLQLGMITRFTSLAQRIDASLKEVAAEIIAADEFIKERA